MTKPGRIPCAVPYCKRTADAAKYEPGTQIICAKCWRIGDAKARRLYRIAERRERFFGARLAREDGKAAATGIPMTNRRWVKWYQIMKAIGRARHAAWEAVRVSVIQRNAGL